MTKLLRSMAIVLVVSACKSGTSAEPKSSDAHDACAGLSVTDGAACEREGTSCRYTGQMETIAPVATPGAPPDCFCNNGRWSCPAVASP